METLTQLERSRKGPAVASDAVLPQQGDDLPRLHVEVHALKGRGAVGVDLVDPAHLDPRGLFPHAAWLHPRTGPCLLRYLLSFDLAREVVLPVDMADPLLAAVDEVQRLQATRQLGMMLRLVDVADALARRPTAAPDGTRLLLGIEDEHAPWNRGVWLLESEGGRLRVRPSRETPQLSCEVGNLAPVYSGLLSPREAVRSGLLTAHEPGAVETAQRLLAASLPVSCPENF